jgi:hypothetical protein
MSFHSGYRSSQSMRLAMTDPRVVPHMSASPTDGEGGDVDRVEMSAQRSVEKLFPAEGLNGNTDYLLSPTPGRRDSDDNERKDGMHDEQKSTRALGISAGSARSTNKTPTAVAPTNQPISAMYTGRSLPATAGVPPKHAQSVTTLAVREKSYIPLHLAKKTIETMQADMQIMKDRHVSAIQQISQYYERIEEETRQNFVSVVGKIKTTSHSELDAYRKTLKTTEAELRILRESSNGRIKDLEDRLFKLEKEHASTLAMYRDSSESTGRQHNEVRIEHGFACCIDIFEHRQGCLRERVRVCE